MGIWLIIPVAMVIVLIGGIVLANTVRTNSKKNEASQRALQLRAEWRKLKDQAIYIFEDKEAENKEYSVPKAKELFQLELKAKRVDTGYYLIQSIQKIYRGDMGMRSVLQSVSELAGYIPDGLRSSVHEDEAVPLRSVVWNNYISTLIRQKNLLVSKRNELIGLSEPRKWTVEEMNKIKGKLGSAIKFSQAKIDSINKNDVDVIQSAISQFRKAISDYEMRVRVARSKIDEYGSLVTDDQLKSVLEFSNEMIALVESEQCKALESFDAHIVSDAPVILHMRWNNAPAEVTVSPQTKAYWEKLCAFSQTIQAFVNKWDEQKF
jgi:hypothetical protein